jgi:regulator of replication initiation timing
MTPRTAHELHSATVAHVTRLEAENAALRAENARLKSYQESSEACIVMMRARQNTADRRIADLAPENAALRAENARLKEANFDLLQALEPVNAPPAVDTNLTF